MPGSLSHFLPFPRYLCWRELVAQEVPTPESNVHLHTSIHACNLHSCREHGLCFLSSKHSPEQPLSLSYIQERGEHEIRGEGGPWLCDLEALLICNKTIAEPPCPHQGSYEE